MKNTIVAIILLLVYNLLFSQSSNNGDAEIEDYSIECVVKNEEDYTTKYSLLLKVNNSNGRLHGELLIPYDNLSGINNIEVSILDGEKNLVRKIKSKEIEDFAYRYGLFHTDDRAKVIHAIHNNYPYYVKLDYEKRTKKLKMLPNWYPQYHGNLFCRNASLTIKIPKDIDLKYKFYNFQPEEQLLQDIEYDVYIWNAKNIKKFEILSEFAPPVKLIASHGIFSMSTEDKSMSSWKDFGHYYSNLIEGLDELPEYEIVKVNDLISDCENDRDKVAILYKYLQDETRYVGIIEGTGGFIPFNADYVCENKYGDCKALTIYMKGLLKAAGVDSYYSLIKSGSKYADIDTTFVSDQFNHVILFVPLKYDTIWLECTTKRLPMGYWGEFCDGKTALVCDYENSRLLSTPELSHHNNSFIRKTNIFIEKNNYTGITKQSLKGEFFEADLYKSDFEDAFGKADEISSNTENENVECGKALNETFSTFKLSTITGDNKVQIFGNNMLIEQPYNILGDLDGMSDFSSKFYIVRNSYKSDTIIYHLPKGYSNEIAEQKVDILNEFGEFSMNISCDTSGIVVVKSLKLNKGIYPEFKYPEFRDFIKEIKTHDDSIILIEKL